MNKLSLEPFTPSLSHSAKERWVCIYPCYINSRKTRERGRKIATEKCVENPKHPEVTFALGRLPLEYLLETKVHPRELDTTEPSIRWRIRVHLKNDEGHPINDQVRNRKALFEYVASVISMMRTKRVPAGPGAIYEQTNLGKKGKKRRK
ncbi:Signal recognition particle protein 19 [Fasciola gigantica]|uniref:Signal recognition particle protein 19 n=1 Tax=Fasciola gigantica TaxID=46835 RepID=A0A504YWX0_FASGI|nr:Signal recognition particle protein 19 [Fasciola gigantica]